MCDLDAFLKSSHIMWSGIVIIEVMVVKGHFTLFSMHVCVCVVDPVEVIGLYKGLLPREFQSSLGNLHPTDPPPLEGEALTGAIKCLIDFLNQV